MTRVFFALFLLISPAAIHKVKTLTVGIIIMILSVHNASLVYKKERRYVFQCKENMAFERN